MISGHGTRLKKRRKEQGVDNEKAAGTGSE
jgi:hypothetical protein